MGQRIEVDSTKVFSKGVDVSEDELISLLKLEQLKSLNLNTSNTNDEHLKIIGQMTTIEDLDLSVTDVTDLGMPYLESLSNLKHLRLKETSITEGCLSSLVKLGKLETLNLKGIDIRDQSVIILGGLTNLEQVVFSSEWLTLGALEKLKESLPECEIINQCSSWRDNVTL